MRLHANQHGPKPLLALAVLFLVFVIQCKISVCYKTEIEITPAPIEEATEKKSGGWFGGFKSFFRNSDTTSKTTTPLPPINVALPTANLPNAAHTGSGGVDGGSVAQKLPPLVIQHAPLMPLGPRPDTPASSLQAGNQHQPPQWPAAGAGAIVAPTTATTTARSPQLPRQQLPVTSNVPANNRPQFSPGFTPYSPQKPHPSGFDLSYGGAGVGGAAHTPTTTTTTVTPALPPVSNFNLRVGFDGTTTTTRRPQTSKDDYSALPLPRRPSKKEDYPALVTPKTLGVGVTETPTGPLHPSSPSAWNTPLPTPSVSFVPHASKDTHTTTTVLPNFQSTSNSLATDDEIRQLTEQLYDKETNSQLNHIQVNIQGKTRSIDSTDEAPNPLLTVHAKALDQPTIAAMRSLFNNYEQDTLVNEHVTPNERKEENDFLNAVMATSVMRQAMLFLQQKGIVTPDPKTHRDLVKELWFTQYSRGQGRIGSSGFEHVFVHEVKNGTIIGFHNWVYVNQEEQAGRFDYKGYMKKLDIGTKGQVLKVRFSYNGLNKPVDTMFIGTSPELELALYTVCFQLRPDRSCPVSLDNNKFSIITYSWRYRGKNLIGSAYPDI